MCKSMDMEEALLELGLGTDLQTVSVARYVQTVLGEFLYVRQERCFHLPKGVCRFVAVCHCQLLILEWQRQEWHFLPLPSYRVIVATVFLHGRGEKRREWESSWLEKC